MKKLRQILKNQAGKIGDDDFRSKTVDQAGGTAAKDSDEESAPGARRKKKAKRKEKPLKLDYKEMRDDDEDDFNIRGGADSEPEQQHESESEDAQDQDDQLSEDGRKLKEQMADAQARISEGKPLLNYNVMVDDEEEEEVKKDLSKNKVSQKSTNQVAPP